MATGKEWDDYFATKSKPYCRKQVKLIEYILQNADKKIIAEFQLEYLQGVKWACLRNLRGEHLE